MRREISMIRFDKVRKRSIGADGTDYGEYITQQVYTTGLLTQTPTGKESEVISIKHYPTDDDINTFVVIFANGEELYVYTIPPFDVAYERIEDETKIK